MAHPTRPNLPAITGLRFFLALLVVAFHASGADGTLRFDQIHVNIYIANLVKSGYAAVGFFFLLSGFVLAYGYDVTGFWNASEWRRFLTARVARIYPVYAAALLISLPLALIVMLKEPGHSPLENTLTLVSAPLLLQAWLPNSSTVWNGPAWSLSSEAFFYVAFPLAGVLLWRTKGAGRILAVFAFLWVTGLLIVAGLSTHFAYDLFADPATAEPIRDTWNAVIKFDPLMHFTAFLLDILTAKIYLHLLDRRGFLHEGRGAWLYFPGLLVEILVATHADKIPYPLMHDGILLPAHAAVILGLSLGGGFIPKFLSTRFMVLLGQASYALYLLHVTVDRAWAISAKHILHRRMFGPGWFSLYVILCVSLSCVVFIYVEEPMRKLILKKFGGPRRDVHLVRG